MSAPRQLAAAGCEELCIRWHTVRLRPKDHFFQLIRCSRIIEFSETIFHALELGSRIFQLYLTFDIHNIARWKVADVIELLNPCIKLVGGLEVRAELILTETRSFLRLPYLIK